MKAILLTMLFVSFQSHAYEVLAHCREARGSTNVTASVVKVSDSHPLVLMYEIVDQARRFSWSEELFVNMITREDGVSYVNSIAQLHVGPYVGQWRPGTFHVSAATVSLTQDMICE